MPSLLAHWAYYKCNKPNGLLGVRDKELNR